MQNTAMAKRLDHCPSCGVELVKPRKQRSHPQLKRFHALMRAAYFHWPASEPFRPQSQDHLRYFLEKEAGLFTVEKTVALHHVDPDLMFPILNAIMQPNKDIKQFVDIDGMLVVVKRVGTISMDELEHPDACRLFAEVDAVLFARGMDPDRLLREHEKAA